jgi:hypothetical protein
MKITTGVRATLRLDLKNVCGWNVGITDRGVYNATGLASYGVIHIPSFIKIGRGVQAIRFGLRNLRCCNVGITDWWDI